MTLTDLVKDWQRARDRGIRRHLTVTKEGIVLGANTVIAKRRDDNGACEIEGREAEILGLISAAFGQAVSPDIISHLRHADRAYGRGDPVTAQIHIAFTGLPKLEDEKLASFRLFLADQLLQSRLGIEELLPPTPSVDHSLSDPLRKASPDDPKHPGWPAGTAGGLGGKFRPKDGTEAVISDEDKQQIESLAARRAIREILFSFLRIGVEAALSLIPGIGEASDVALFRELLEMAGQYRQLRIDTQAAIDFVKTRPHTLAELSAAADAASEPGYENHHIVMQGGTNRMNIPEEQLQRPDNIVRVPTLLHERITAEYFKASRVMPGMKVYQWLQTQPFDVQYDEGVKIMRDLKIIQ